MSAMRNRSPPTPPSHRLPGHAPPPLGRPMLGGGEGVRCPVSPRSWRSWYRPWAPCRGGRGSWRPLVPASRGRAVKPARGGGLGRVGFCPLHLPLPAGPADAFAVVAGTLLSPPPPLAVSRCRCGGLCL